MFYDRFRELCTQKGVKPTRAAIEMGFSNATPTKWKNTGSTPELPTLATIAAYFAVPIESLLSDEERQKLFPAGRMGNVPEDVDDLVKKFSSLPDDKKKLIMGIIDIALQGQQGGQS